MKDQRAGEISDRHRKVEVPRVDPDDDAQLRGQLEATSGPSRPVFADRAGVGKLLENPRLHQRVDRENGGRSGEARGGHHVGRRERSPAPGKVERKAETGSASAEIV